MVFKTGNGIIQTGNGIISPISWPLIKKLILQKVSNFYNGVQNWCWKEEMDWCKQDMELYLLYFVWSDSVQLSFTKLTIVHHWTVFDKGLINPTDLKFKFTFSFMFSVYVDIYIYVKLCLMWALPIRYYVPCSTYDHLLSRRVQKVIF